MILTQLQKINPQDLPISDYNRRYLQRMQPLWDYYEEIYSHCLSLMLDRLAMPREDVVMVDYGGGHGALSLLAKEMGVGQVVYIDSNPQCAETVGVLSDQLGLGPDVILQGEADTLRSWCLRDQVRPHCLMGMDVIEHIYCLDDFFSEILRINPGIEMLFTTGSNPENRRVTRRLHDVMAEDERHYSELRREYIRTLFPDLSDEALEQWTRDTRGLTYDDIQRAVESQSPNILADPFNTCDPRNGNWTERILPVSDYSQILQQYGHHLDVLPGFHNTHKSASRQRMAAFVNRMIARSQSIRHAPWIILRSSSRPWPLA